MSPRACSKPARANWLVTPDKFLSPDQVAVLRASVEAAPPRGTIEDDRVAVRNAVMVESLLGTGLRVSELCALRIADLYLQNGRADVLVRRGKGGKARLIAISARLREYLREYLGWRGAAADGTPDGPLFVSGRGGQLASAGLPTMWGVHATRHSFAVEVYRRTRDLRLTQRLLGHASVATTTTYANLLDEDMRRGVERIWAV